MIFIALLLLVEGLSSGFGFYQLVPSLRYLSWPVVILAVLRALTGIMQWVGGMSLLMRRYQFVRLCQIALVASATLTIFEIGLRLMPNNLDPTWRWPLTALYWVYALAASAFIGREEVRVDHEVRMARASEGEGQSSEVPVGKASEVRDEKGSEEREGKASEVREEKGSEVREGQASEVREKKASEVREDKTPEAFHANRPGPPERDPDHRGGDAEDLDGRSGPGQFD